MDGPLDSRQLREFAELGFLVCERLWPDERQAELAGWVEEIASWPSTPGRWHHHREQTAAGAVLARTENFLPFHPGLRGLLCDGALAAAVGQLFGEAALVFKEKINYKYPGGGGFAPHQDAVAYPLGSLHITALVAVDANCIANGCLWFAPGQHAAGRLPTAENGCLPDDLAQQLEWVPAETPAGGIVFFSSFIPHKSPPNNSDQPRRSLYVTYNKSSEGNLREEYYAARQRTMDAQSASGTGPRLSTIGHFQGRGIDA